MIKLPYSTPDGLLRDKYSQLDLAEEYVAKQFRHLYDFYINQRGESDKLRTADQTISSGFVDNNLVASFVRTYDDNEDPTMLGFDIRIKIDDSPIFNGQLRDFINIWNGLGNTEIGSRLIILEKFQEQFFKFFKKDLTINGVNANPLFLKTEGAKSYYLEEITGLDKLNEKYQGPSGESGDGGVFVDYPKEFISLKFREDVSQNLGYLYSLYKSLSWSRINGKSIVPDNLLRFDCEIVVTEIRDYMRLFKNNDNTIQEYVDKISRYKYELYECQFFFTDMPHGDAISMIEAANVISPSIKFNYKFSTLKFERFTTNPDNPAEKNNFFIDNKLLNPTQITPKTANILNTNNGQIQLEDKGILGKLAQSISPDGISLTQSLETPGREGDLENFKTNDFLSQFSVDTVLNDIDPVLAAQNLTQGGSDSGGLFGGIGLGQSLNAFASGINLNSLSQNVFNNIVSGGDINDVFGSLSDNINLNALGQSVLGDINLPGNLGTSLQQFGSGINFDSLSQGISDAVVSGNFNSLLGSVSDSIGLNSLGQSVLGNVSLGGALGDTIRQFNDSIDLNSLAQTVINNVNSGGNFNDVFASVTDSLDLNSLGQSVLGNVSIGGQLGSVIRNLGDSIDVGNLSQTLTDSITTGNFGNIVDSLSDSINVNSLGQSVLGNLSLGGNIGETLGKIGDSIDLGGLSQTLTDSITTGNFGNIVDSLSDSIDVNSLGQSVLGNISLGGNLGETLRNISDSIPLNDLAQNVIGDITSGSNIMDSLSGAASGLDLNQLGQSVLGNISLENLGDSLSGNSVLADLANTIYQNVDSKKLSDFGISNLNTGGNISDTLGDLAITLGNALDSKQILKEISNIKLPNPPDVRLEDLVLMTKTPNPPDEKLQNPLIKNPSPPDEMLKIEISTKDLGALGGGLLDSLSNIRVYTPSTPDVPFPKIPETATNKNESFNDDGQIPVFGKVIPNPTGIGTLIQFTRDMTTFAEAGRPPGLPVIYENVKDFKLTGRQTNYTNVTKEILTFDPVRGGVVGIWTGPLPEIIAKRFDDQGNLLAPKFAKWEMGNEQSLYNVKTEKKLRELEERRLEEKGRPIKPTKAETQFSNLMASFPDLPKVTPAQIGNLIQKNFQIQGVNLTRQVQSQINLIDKTLSNFAGEKRDEVINSVQNFVGESVRGLFN